MTFSVGNLGSKQSHLYSPYVVSVPSQLHTTVFHLQLEIHHDDEKLTTEATGISGSGCGGGTSGQTSDVCVTKPTSLADELDNLMDISIEIASNKRMKKDYIKPFKLTFKDKEMEKKVSLVLITFL